MGQSQTWVRVRDMGPRQGEVSDIQEAIQVRPDKGHMQYIFGQPYQCYGTS